MHEDIQSQPQADRPKMITRSEAIQRIYLANEAPVALKRIWQRKLQQTLDSTLSTRSVQNVG